MSKSILPADQRSEPILYFAYGSNMSIKTLSQRCPSAREVGAARLDEYRLRFSRQSKKSGTGVADIVRESGFAVRGILYEVSYREWDSLRRKEGLELEPPAYKQIELQVYSVPDRSFKVAETFVVADPEPLEQLPSAEYIDDMIEQVENRKLYPYGQFLRWLRRQLAMSSQCRPLREGLLVTGTTVRPSSRGRYIVRANPASISKSKRTRTVIIEFDGRTTIAAFQPSIELPTHMCQVDQNLRNAIGMNGPSCFGHTVRLQSHHGAWLVSTLARPRNLCLKVRQTNWTDSEKRICILHPNNITLLGIKEGEHVEIECATRNRYGGIDSKSARLRVYASERKVDQLHGYPALDHVYLDRECRSELGLPLDRGAFADWPVLIRPSVSHLLRRRIIIYGITFFLGSASVSQLLALMLPILAGPARGVAAIATAAAATIMMAVVDIRANVSYT